MFNKRAVGQHTPGRRKVKILKIAPYFTRAGALFFACCINNKSNNGTKHNCILFVAGWVSRWVGWSWLVFWLAILVVLLHCLLFQLLCFSPSCLTLN